MGFLAAVLLGPVVLSAQTEEIAPNSPTSVVRPAAPTKPAIPTTPSGSPSTPAVSVSEPAVATDMPTKDDKAAAGRKPIAVSSTARQREDAFSKSKHGNPEKPTTLSAGKQLTWWTTTGVGLAAVLAVIFVGGRIVRRVVPGAMVGEASGPVHLLHRTYLSPKHTACLVKCGDRLLLVGIAGDRMTTLTEIHDPQEIDFIRGQLMQVSPRSTTKAFRDSTSARALTEAANDPGTAYTRDPSRESGNRTFAQAASTRGGSTSPSPTFADQLAALRDRISEWKSKAKPT